MKTVLLGDICSKVTSGGTPSTKHPEYYGGDIPWLRTQEVDFGRIHITERTITEDGLKNSSAKLIPKNSVIIAMYGATAGKSAINKIPLTTNQACCNLIIDPQKANYEYIYYYLLNNYEGLLSSATGAAQQNLGTTQISKMPVDLPGLNDQDKIANTLGKIDEKIELNRWMNETLEQIGQALFRHYFIDNPESKTWPKGKISDLGTVITGKTPSKKNDEFFGGETFFLKIPDMHSQSMIIKTEDSLTELGASSQRNKTLPRYSTCVSCIATVGLVSLTTRDTQTNQQINSIVPRDFFRLHNYFLMLTMSDELRMRASGGTATLNLNKNHFENIKVKLPPNDLLKKFDGLVLPIVQQIEDNLLQNERLTKLRDSLMPRLISGKLKV